VLTIGKIGGADADGRSAGYYTASVAKGRDDYYTGRGEAPGEWFGAACGALGLVGEVDAEDFRAVVMDARAPSGEVLRELVGDKPVRGFDLTFSAPKSASLLYFLGEGDVPGAVRQAHDEAVVAALGYMEREACVVRAGKGGRDGKTVGGGFVGGLFRHRTSRALDPQLHTHAVVANFAERGADGRRVALDATALYHQAKTGGTVYQAELRARLTTYLGVEWGPVRNGMAEIAGIPPAALARFSRRRAAIVGAAGDASAAALQRAALETRPAKEAVDLERLVEAWRAGAAELGLDAGALDRLLGRVRERRQPCGPALSGVAEELAGERGLTRRSATFDRRAAVQAFAAAHPHGASVERLEHLADRFLESAHAVPMEGRPAVVGPDTIRRRDGSLVVRATGAKYTTPGMLACEARLAAGALARRGEGAGTAEEARVSAALTARPGLAGEQERMVWSLTRSGDGVEVVRAAAGTGKTHSLDVAREAWEASGRRVVGAALSARAACELRDTGGIDSTTVAQMVMDLAQLRRQPLNPLAVITTFLAGVLLGGSLADSGLGDFLAIVGGCTGFGAGLGYHASMRRAIGAQST